ncbi:MAG: class D sortase [Clostridia bacterium]|nr:class D sortase [Clostridia bacterium]
MSLNYIWTSISKQDIEYGIFNKITQEERKQNKMVQEKNNIVTEEFTDNQTEESVEVIEKATEEIRQIGTIKIPIFNVVAPVAEGTSEDIMNQYVGHFENTSLWDGNIGLAAHNRGYPVNYFANIKDLQIGDEIIYEIENQSRTYLVNEITIIEDTDWSYLQETNDNRITLITCVENEPSYRRCIQGIEKK